MSRIRNAVAAMLEIPASAVASEAEVCISRSCTMIYGCLGVLEYAPETVKVAVRGGTVTVSGSSLTLECFLGKDMKIKGKIDHVGLEYEKAVKKFER